MLAVLDQEIYLYFPDSNGGEGSYSTIGDWVGNACYHPSKPYGKETEKLIESVIHASVFRSTDSTIIISHNERKKHLEVIQCQNDKMYTYQNGSESIKAFLSETEANWNFSDER